MSGLEARPPRAQARPQEPATPAPRRPVPRLGPPRRRTVLVLLVAVTVLLGGGTWAVYGSPWFRATKVRVEGNKELTVDQVERAARVPLGGALVSVDTGAVRRRLLKALPRIDRVAVDRSWPHTVTVEVTERVAAAVVRSGRAYTEVDGRGVRFATVDRPPAGVPLVQLLPASFAGPRQFGAKDLLRGAITVAADLPRAVRARARAVRVRSYDGITVELSGGREVVWGSPEQGARKAAVLTALMTARPHAVRYDVSAPTSPAAAGS
ncbi:FtsQ-type POTRA domain-containing protein [Streptomyces sp. HPF1205]|uniref:cell division protein FtsQ/DivIB n=1 Tax=Streptomyces sp. HPF1205 TaxID=2873262 RepID=UPI001CECAE0A|nr:FtsQ-type POTRA domain-containing protein [Streptomyces sp. HPF1205]